MKLRVVVGDHPPLQIERVIEVLDRHAVQYMLIGGVAALLHGAQRPTLDLDLLPHSDRENLGASPPRFSSWVRTCVLAG